MRVYKTMTTHVDKQKNYDYGTANALKIAEVRKARKHQNYTFPKAS